MIKSTTLLLAFLLPFSLLAQIQDPAQWRFEAVPSEGVVGNVIELIFKADIDKEWYLYSSDFDPDLGPKVTEIIFTPDKSYELVGKLTAIKPKKKYDDIWGGEYTYFVDKGEFRQKVRILSENLKIEGEYDYQTCTLNDGMCIPFNKLFSFSGKIKVKKGRVPQMATPETADTFAVPDLVVEEGTDEATVREMPLKKSRNVVATIPGEDETDSGLWAFFLVAFLSGVVALITPCVFPMIPMTVTFFTNSNQKRIDGIKKALFYGLSIIGIYTIIGTIVAKLVGPEAANFLSTHWIPNVFFFLIFMVFAASFLGMFEIVLPTWLVNKADQQADKGGYYGVFFMAFTIALVSFSCTGPIVGSILVQSASGANLRPVIGMFGFSLAFAIPFTLFAIFPSWLSSLPRSGGWLNSVKVVLGFLELALALKFLSIADQVYHWGILDREVFLSLWIVIFGLLGAYLLNFIKLPHDSPSTHTSVPRLLLAVFVLSFTVYLIPGLWGAPLKGLTGYLPPMTTQQFDLGRLELSQGSKDADAQDLPLKPLFADRFKLPHGLKGYFDYNQALEAAKILNKPVFIDFTGHGCVNCREMESKVWSDQRVLDILRKDFVVLALYVDDKGEYPQEKWYTSTYDNRLKKTIGSQNADLQITRFNNNAQPYYILLDPDGDLLVPPTAYDLNVQHFIDFLESGKAEMKK